MLSVTETMASVTGGWPARSPMLGPSPARSRPPTAKEPVLTSKDRAKSGSPGHPAGLRGGRRWRRVAIALAAVIIAVSALTGRLFVWPAQGMPARVDAIVMLNAPGATLPVALRLARQHRARYLLISQGTVASHYACPRPVPQVKLICFHPSPATTQGEAEFAGRQARLHHWRSVAVVAITPQVSRARLRLERCFGGQVYVMTAPIPLGSWPYEIAYEWGALAKAVVLQRSC
jgi:hypothetical protein